MTKNPEENLLRLAEDIAYASKGHFKTADWISASPRIYLFFPLMISFLLMAFTFPDYAVKLLSAVSFAIALFAILSQFANNLDSAKVTIEKHMELGNKYLALYKEIRTAYFSASEVESTAINDFTNRNIAIIEQSGPYRICFIGRWWAKIRIEEEMGLDWIYKNR
jgi:hypothetical protein